MSAPEDKHYEYVMLNGEQVRVEFVTDGRNVDIITAEKEVDGPDENGPQQEETEAPKQKTKVSVQLSPQEEQQLEKQLEETVQKDPQFADVREKTALDRAQIYDSEISPNLFDSASQSENPTVVFLAGQGGSMKSGLAANELDRFAADGSAVKIDPDDLRKYNFDYGHNIRTDPYTAADRANVSDWTEEAYKEALGRGVNIVMDGTGSNAENVTRRMEMAHDAGYKVEYHHIASNSVDSYLRIQQRREDGITNDYSNPGDIPEARNVPKRVHDPASVGSLSTLAAVEQGGYADKVLVWQAGNYEEPKYENTEAHLGACVGGAIVAQEVRNKPSNAQELAAREEKFKDLQATMEAHGATPSQRADAMRLGYEGYDLGFSQAGDVVTFDRRPNGLSGENTFAIDGRLQTKAEQSWKTADAAILKNVDKTLADVQQKGMMRDLSDPILTQNFPFPENGQETPKYISAAEYISNPEAQKYYQAQTEAKMEAHFARLESKGTGAEEIASLKAGMQERLNSPAETYALGKELDLAQKRASVDVTRSENEVHGYYIEKAQASQDIAEVKRAFGVEVPEKSPEELKTEQVKEKWAQKVDIQVARLHKNIDLGYISPHREEAETKSIKGLGEESCDKELKDNDLLQSIEQTQKELSTRQSGPSMKMHHNPIELLFEIPFRRTEKRRAVKELSAVCL